MRTLFESNLVWLSTALIGSGGTSYSRRTTRSRPAATWSRTVDEIAGQLEALRRAGIQYVLLNIGGMSRDSLRTFAREIMPAFAVA